MQRRQLRNRGDAELQHLTVQLHQHDRARAAALLRAAILDKLCSPRHCRVGRVNHHAKLGTGWRRWGSRAAAGCVGSSAMRQAASCASGSSFTRSCTFFDRNTRP